MSADTTQGEGAKKTTTQTPEETSASAHNVFVALLGELIGISVLAIFADMNEDVGKVAVALMAGWFVMFLIFNASSLQSIIGKV